MNMSGEQHKTDNGILLDLYNEAGEAMNLVINQSNLAEKDFLSNNYGDAERNFAAMTLGLDALHKALTNEKWMNILAPDTGRGM